MTEVVGLGYLGIRATDMGAWRSYAQDLLGLQIVGSESEDEMFLRADERGWRFRVARSDSDGLGFVGWEVAHDGALDALCARLTGAGVPVEENETLAAERQVRRLVTCTDPNGVALEFFCGAYVPQEPFVSPQGHTFCTGALGLGHIVLMVDDLTSARDFYLDTLGFRLSDVVLWAGGEVVFTHVNRRHHSLALAEVKGVPQPLAHFMLQVTELDSVGRALDKVLAGAADLTQTFGRHTNDHMLSFYSKSPSGFEVEFGTGAREIDDDWVITQYDAPSYWGHRMLTSNPAV